MGTPVYNKIKRIVAVFILMRLWCLSVCMSHPNILVENVFAVKEFQLTDTVSMNNAGRFIYPFTTFRVDEFQFFFT